MGMLRSMAARRVGAVIVALVALIPLAVQPLPAAAAGTGTLFAITGSTGAMLSRVDPTSGTVTPIVDLSGPDQGQVGTITGDPFTHRIFAVRTSVTFVPPGAIFIHNELLIINSQSGAFTIAGDVNRSVGQIALDQSTNSLYVIGSQGIFRLDASSGATTLVSSLGNVGGSILSMAIDPGSHNIYVDNITEMPDGSRSSQILTVNPQTGAVSSSPALDQTVRMITFDSSASGLFGVTNSDDLVRIDTSLGTETVVGNLDNGTPSIYPTGITEDPTTNTIFVGLQISFDPSTSGQLVSSMNDQTGVLIASPAPSDTILAMYFEPVVVGVTPASLRADLQAAIASGAIDNAGVAKTLLAELDAAAAARTRGQCKTAGNTYQQFINDLKAQSGKHVSAAAATQLAGEAQFLITHCP
jgi:hypothetical protein